MAKAFKRGFRGFRKLEDFYTELDGTGGGAKMGKKQKQQKRLIKELEHALAQMEQDWRNEHENAGCLLRSLMRNMSERATERKRHNMIVDAMAEGVNRVVGERDAALADVETLTDANAEADATIGELRALVEQQRKDWSGDVEASREIVERKSNEIVDLWRTISELRGDLADTHERLDAALTEAARMRKDWSGDVAAAQEIIERKNTVIMELRSALADARLERDEALADAEVTALKRG